MEHQERFQNFYKQAQNETEFGELRNFKSMKPIFLKNIGRIDN